MTRKAMTAKTAAILVSFSLFFMSLCSEFDRKDDRKDGHRPTGFSFSNGANYQYNGFSKSLVSESNDSLVKVEKNFYKVTNATQQPLNIHAYRKVTMSNQDIQKT